MNVFKKFFQSKYKSLLEKIKKASHNQAKITLPNGVIVDFRPGKEYEDCNMVLVPRNEGDDFVQKYTKHIDQIITIEVYACFSGEVRLLAVGVDRIYVEIVDVSPCYSCQGAPLAGQKFWIADWKIPKANYKPQAGFDSSDLPF